ncbi:AAA family ATPase, partial [Salmonella enterica]|uniref:AAA family ATPase n=1 Tax=Salmonella enterica TaxID=28901 RepID=UPI00329A5059
LTRAVRDGAICYLDEVVEARKDTTVVLHPLSDFRRQLPIERLGVTLNAAPGFCLVVSYNPGYQSVLKDLKDSTRQRMVAIEFD